MATLFSREIRLVSRPHGFPSADHFAMTSTQVPDVTDGEVLVRNLYMSVDPYMRTRMNAGKSYVPPWEPGDVLDGAAIGEVVASRAPAIREGILVASRLGWREYFVADSRALRVLDPMVTPISSYLGVLGGTGLTAWVGLNLVEMKPGDRVFVSGAAGAVGHVAGQLAKIAGCFVVGSAGSDHKVALLKDLGFDAAFNYKHGDIPGQLNAAAPDGIDLYFDNVGGDHLEAAIAAMRLHGRISACGTISTYNDDVPRPGPRNLFQIVAKRLTIKGFIVLDSLDQMSAFIERTKEHVTAGRLRGIETVVEGGLERAPAAFLEMLQGQNLGKMIVKLT